MNSKPFSERAKCNPFQWNWTSTATHLSTTVRKKKELSWVALSQGHSTSASFSFIPANILELLRVLIIADINMKRKKKIVCRGCPDQMHGRCRRARGRRFTNSKVSSVVPSEYLGHTYKEVGDFIHVSLVTSPQRGI